MGKDYYAVLGVKKGASENDIRKAYKKMAVLHHPDKNPGDESAVERFKEVGEAYEVLSDPQKKSLFDTYGTIDPQGSYGGGGGGGGGGDYQYSSSFGGGNGMPDFHSAFTGAAGMRHAEEVFRNFFANFGGFEEMMGGMGGNFPPQNMNRQGSRNQQQQQSNGGMGMNMGNMGMNMGMNMGNMGMSMGGMGGFPSMFGGSAFGNDDFFNTMGGGGSSSFSSFSSSSGGGRGGSSVQTTTVIKNGKKVTRKTTTVIGPDGQPQTTTEEHEEAAPQVGHPLELFDSFFNDPLPYLDHHDHDHNPSPPPRALPAPRKKTGMLRKIVNKIPLIPHHRHRADTSVEASAPAR